MGDMNLETLANDYFSETLLEAGLPPEIQAGISSSLSKMSNILNSSGSEEKIKENQVFQESLARLFGIVGVDYSVGIFENYQDTGQCRMNGGGNNYNYQPTDLSIIASSKDDNNKIEISSMQKKFCKLLMKNNAITKEDVEDFGLEIPKEFNIDPKGEDYIISPITDTNRNTMGVIVYQPRFKSYLGNKFYTSDKGEMTVSDLLNEHLNIIFRGFLERVTDSDTDDLTGLYMRKKAYSLLKQGIEAELKKYQITDNPERKLTLYYIDIDDFGAVNNDYGHDIGDIVLQRVSNQLRQATRNPDYVSRWGGEELLVQGETKDGDGSFVAERLRKRINEIDFSDVMEDRPHVSISIGYAKFKNKGEPPEEMLRLADEAMYFSKKTGKNKATNAKNLIALLTDPKYEKLRKDPMFKSHLYGG